MSIQNLMINIFLFCLLLFTAGCYEEPQTAEQPLSNRYVYTHIKYEYTNISRSTIDINGVRYYTMQYNDGYFTIPSHRVTIFIDKEDYIDVYTKVDNETGKIYPLPERNQEAYLHITEETLGKLKRYD